MYTVGSCKPTPTRTKSRCCCGGKSELRRLSKGRTGGKSVQLWIVHVLILLWQWALPSFGSWAELNYPQAVGPRKQSLLGGTKITAEATHRPAGGHCSTVTLQYQEVDWRCATWRRTASLQQSVQPYCFCHVLAAGSLISVEGWAPDLGAGCTKTWPGFCTNH